MIRMGSLPFEIIQDVLGSLESENSTSKFSGGGEDDNLGSWRSQSRIRPQGMGSGADKGKRWDRDRQHRSRSNESQNYKSRCRQLISVNHYKEGWRVVHVDFSPFRCRASHFSILRSWQSLWIPDFTSLPYVIHTQTNRRSSPLNGDPTSPP